MVKRKSSIGIVVLIVCMSLAFHNARAQPQSPAFKSIDCPVSFSMSRAARISCGFLHVPEVRSEPSGRWIDVFVAVVAAEKGGALPPLLVLAGGPGDAASGEVAAWLEAGLHQSQDIIFVDQRGSGRSLPSLNCPEFDEPLTHRLDACRARLLADGINLAAYNPDAITSDIVDLIMAMNLQALNIYGVSYGARLARAAAERLPGRVKALVLDSAYPSEESAIQQMLANTERAMQRVFADCSSDPACAKAYPRLPALFEQALAALNRAPILLDGFFPAADLQLDGGGFLQLLRAMLADSARLPYIPSFVSAVAEGDRAALARMGAIRFDDEPSTFDDHSEGLYMSLICAEIAAAASVEKILAAAEASPAPYAPLARSALELLKDCVIWSGESASAQSTLPASVGAPMLSLHGRYDPVAGIDDSAPQSAPGWRYVDPQLGHGILLDSQCAQHMTVAFLTHPSTEPWHDCLHNQQPLDFTIGGDH